MKFIKPKRLLFAVILSAVFLAGCTKDPIKQNDYINSLEKSKKSLDKLKDINAETKTKADAYEKGLME